MQLAIIKVATLALDVALRVWMREKDSYVVNSVLDVERFITKAGCDVFEKMQLKTNLDKCIAETGKKLYSAHFFAGIEEERQKEIANQLASDLKNFNVLDEEFYEKILSGKNIAPAIISRSETIRGMWDEKDRGAYNNCVRFVSDAIVKFVTGLPSFSTEAMKILYKQNDEIWRKFERRLEDIYSLIKGTEDIQADYREFQTDYLRNVESVNGKVELFGSGITKRTIKQYELSTAYVELNCIDSENDDDYEVELSTVFDNGNIVWIGGEPGGGKTTFLQWIAISAAKSEGNIKSIAGLVPIILKLREVSFPINYKNEIDKAYNMQCPDGWIEYLFKNDRVLLLFDGLDEIQENYRYKVYEEIERINKRYSFAYKKRRSKIVVTSRMHVDDELRCEHSFYEIKRMKMPSIEKFVRYWHDTILKDNCESKEKIEEESQNIIDNIAKSQSLRLIAGTPLLCAMICALGYSNGGVIPTDKIEIYAKCSQMLVRGRDEERRISIDKKLAMLEYDKWERILEDIAYYMMISECVTMDKKMIVAHLVAFLKDSTLVSDELRDNPVILVDYLIQRAGIIREPTVGKIDFVHKTFMEYMAAKAIDKRQEYAVISSKILSNFWKETIIMSFGLFDRTIASELLKNLIDRYKETENREYIFMASLCAKSAKDISIVTNDVIDNAVRSIIPPKEVNHILKLAETGDIVVPFLYDSSSFTDEDRKNCLIILGRLVEYVETPEVVLVIFSYITGKGDEQVKEQAARNLCQSPPQWIDEHSIKEKMTKWLRSVIRKSKSIEVSDYMLSIISTKNVSGIFDGIEEVKLTLHDNFSRDEYSIDPEIFKAWSKIKKLRICNILGMKQLEILDYIEQLEELSVDVSYDEDILIDKLSHYSSVKEIKSLEYKSRDLTFICGKDLSPFSRVEIIKLELLNPNIEIDLSDLEIMKKIEHFDLTISESAYENNDRQIDSLYESEKIDVRIVPI